jgi:hypothetical protein
LLNNEPSPNPNLISAYWPVIIVLLYCLSAWLLSKNTTQ